jgi:AraC-like DNA-binding protein
MKNEHNFVAGYISQRRISVSNIKNGKNGEKDKDKDIVDLVARYILGLQLEDLRVIKIKDISRTFDINASFLSRKFKSRKNCTLCEFIQMEKMQRAAALLQEMASLRINDLSDYLGFSSTEYFIRSFKKKMGVPPNTYRKLRKMKNDLENNNAEEELVVMDAPIM